LFGVSNEKDSGLSVDDLVRANKAAVESVRNIDMRIKVYRTGWRGQRLEEPIHLSSQRWSKEFDKERQRYAQHLGRGPDAEGNPHNIGDLIETSDQRRVLLNWDPTNPQRITPHRQGTVRAWFEPPTPNLPGDFPNPQASMALFQIQANLVDTRWTLDRLVAESPSVKVTESTGEQGNQLWKLLIAHPDNKTNGPFENSRYEVILDPNANYLISSIVAYIADVDPSPENTVPIRTERQVTEFARGQDGTYFPKRVVARLYDGNAAPDAAPASEQLSVAEDVVINAELPADSFDFSFPEHSVVHELMAADGSMPLHVWGSDDKPAKTHTGDYHDFRFPSAEELEKEFADTTTPGYRYTLIAVTAAIVLALAAFVCLRRWRERQNYS